MKVLVSTIETQGKRKNDFCHVPEGELVGFGTECDGESVDGGCGCRRSLIGLENLKATTTFKVVDLPLTLEELEGKIRAGLDKGGWLSILDEQEANKIIKSDANELNLIADYFGVGAVLEKRGRDIQRRA